MSRAPDEAAGAKEPDLSNREADIVRAGVTMAVKDTVDLYGSAGAEFIVGLRGVNNQTGDTLATGLAAIAQHKVSADPLEAARNIKQQAGFAAEVAATSRDNAKAILAGSRQRTVRSDDLPQFGKNHPVVDRVLILDGQIIEGSEAQMKFVGDRNTLFSRIAKEDGKFSRYRGVKLELPSEQYDGAQAFCQEQAKTLRENAHRVEQDGKPEIAAKLRREAANYEQLGENVQNSGLTTDDAIFYRKHPGLATLHDMAKNGHGAGIEAAKGGAIVGGSISALKQAFALAQGKADARDAGVQVAQDVAKAGAVGYATAFVGSATKAAMQQSAHSGIRVLANTSAPTLVVNVCISLGTSIKSYVAGDITESELLAEVGEKGAGMLSSSMMAALGQVVIPIPIVGAAIGGMVGYTLSSIFYQSALDAAKGAEHSREVLDRVRAIEAAARCQIAQEQAALDDLMACEMPQLRRQTLELFLAVNAVAGNDVDDMVAAIDRYATLLGKQLQFASQAEFDTFMASEEPLRL